MPAAGLIGIIFPCAFCMLAAAFSMFGKAFFHCIFGPLTALIH